MSLQNLINYAVITTLAYSPKRKRCDSRIESDVFSLGCGCKTSKGDRTVLRSDVAQNVYVIFSLIAYFIM